ncbi:MAG: DUF3298 and DUF4163 domain-containing protein [Vulcanibacillus sp.]
MEVRELPVDIKNEILFKNTVNITYPQVCNIRNHQVEQRINKKIIKEVDYLISKQGYYENYVLEMIGKYELKTNQRGILSLTLINYAFTGGAHGMTYVNGLTFDVDKGDSYKLKDLFKKDSNYVQRLSAIIKKQIEERDIPVLGEFKEIDPDQDFYISDKVLVIYFQLYELTPYAYGFPFFPISVYEIEDIIDEKGILGRMLNWYNY